MHKQTFKSRFFSSSKWAILYVFSWELVEETLESLIAYTISSVMALFIAKMLSTFAIVFLTQGAKTVIKRFCYKFTKEITYQNGRDKMTKIKQFFSWIFANKKTIIGTIGALATSGATAYATYGGYFSFLPELMIGNFNVMSVIVGLVCFLLVELGVTGKGFESIATFGERIMKETEVKHQKQILKLAKKEIAEEEKKANQTQAEQEKAEAKALAQKQAQEEKAMADAKLRAEIEQAKLSLKK